MQSLSAVVVGGGIAGLAAAASLVRAGWTVTVLERAPAFGEVGAGLAVTRNGMAALATMGVDQAVRAAGHVDRMAGTQDHRGRWLLKIAGSDPASVAANWVCGVHRQRLHAVLAEAAQETELITGAEVISVRQGGPDGAPASVTWHSDDGSERTQEAAMLVAADGANSAVRSALFSDSRLRYSGKTCWRAVIDDADAATDGFVVSWGPETEFGALRINANQVYWYGYFQHAADAIFDDELQAAQNHFRNWSSRVRSVVTATRSDQIMRHDVYHLPSGVPEYTLGRTVMIGDAAHAMLPTMGQGANTSLEDGVCVGRLIAKPVVAGKELGAALSDFDSQRRPRCRQIAKRSIMTERMGADLGAGWQHVARNAAMRLVPGGLAAKVGTKVLDWKPPRAVES